MGEWDPRRRQLLRRVAAVGTVGLAGCGSPSATGPETTEQPTAPCYATDPVAPTRPGDVAAVHPARVDEGGTLNLVPADEAQPPSVVWDRYDGDIDVKLDLVAAYEQRRYTSRAWDDERQDAIETFLNAVRTAVEDPQTEVAREHYRDYAAGDATLGLLPSGDVDWETYLDGSRPLDERLSASGLLDFWHVIANLETNALAHDFQLPAYAHSLQMAERLAGVDTVIWDGGKEEPLIGAIAGATRDPNAAGDQSVSVIQFDPRADQRVAAWDESPAVPAWFEADTPEEENRVRNFYGKTAFDGYDAEFIPEFGFDPELWKRFRAFLNQPETCPAYTHLDPAVAALHVAAENVHGSVKLGIDELRLER